jgi:transcriptional regulator with XRE-family HTH domain
MLSSYNEVNKTLTKGVKRAMTERKQIGERLRKLRGDKSREEVAIAIGVTAQAISNYEIGIRVPSDIIKCKLAEYFGKTVQSIFYD